jgi:hypothetical protein
MTMRCDQGEVLWEAFVAAMLAAGRSSCCDVRTAGTLPWLARRLL